MSKFKLNPKINVKKVSSEVKAYLYSKKMDLIDWGYTSIECYPEVGDQNTPELNKFAKMWEGFFDYSDTVTQDDGSGFPNDVVQRYEILLQKVEEAVNGDSDYWTKIRAEVLPFYLPPEESKGKLVQDLSSWKDRWNAIKLFYDPVGMEVVTTQILTNQATGERRRGNVVSRRMLKAGFVIRVI
jgi:hypothetical protein